MNIIHTLLLVLLSSHCLTAASEEDKVASEEEYVYLHKWTDYLERTVPIKLENYINNEQMPLLLRLRLFVESHYFALGLLDGLSDLYLERRRLTIPPEQRNPCEQRIIHKLLNGPKIRLALMLRNELEHPTDKPKNGLDGITRAIDKALISCHSS